MGLVPGPHTRTNRCPPGVALLHSLQAGAAWVRWREKDGRRSPYFPLVQGQALPHAECMGVMK